LVVIFYQIIPVINNSGDGGEGGGCAAPLGNSTATHRKASIKRDDALEVGELRWPRFERVCLDVDVYMGA
jgi:hypothetical protein